MVLKSSKIKNGLKINFDGFHILYNNYKIKGRGNDHLLKGGRIIFSTKFYQAQQDAESLPPTTTDTKGKYGGIIIELPLKLQSYDNNGIVIRGEFFKTFVVSVYHPCNRRHLDKEHWERNRILDTLLSRPPNNAEIIMDADFS